MRTIFLLLVCVVPSLLVQNAASAAPAARGLAFAGLRPVRDAQFEQTELQKLSEAQRLRGIVQEVLEAVSGYRVATHDDMRGLLGRGYLVDVFECAGKVKCLSGLLQPVMSRGFERAVVGDYRSENDGFVFRLRVLELKSGKVLDEATFGLAASEVEDLSAWRGYLEPLFSDTGSLKIVANVAGYTCTLDTQPCVFAEGGVIKNVAEGEHVLELNKEGYLKAARVVNVVRRKEVSVAVALAEKPLEAPAAPTVLQVPAAPVAQAGMPAPRLNWFGQLQLSLAIDDLDSGGTFEFFATPTAPDSKRQAFATWFPGPTYVGVAASPVDAGNWTVSGLLIVGFVTDLRFQLLAGYADLTRKTSGTKISLGLINNAVVSTLGPSVPSLPFGWGNLYNDIYGARVTQPFGSILTEFAVGQPSTLGGPVPGSISRVTPTMMGRIAYINDGVKGRVGNATYPLTLGFSGAYGQSRVGGPAEQANLVAVTGDAAAQSKQEDLPAYLGSFELLVPLGSRLALTGEAFVGQGLRRFTGAIFQRERVDPATGKHTLPKSVGGWGQLEVGLSDSFSLSAYGGQELVNGNLESGVDLYFPLVIKSNQALGGTVRWYGPNGFSLFLQSAMLQTKFAGTIDATFKAYTTFLGMLLAV